MEEKNHSKRRFGLWVVLLVIIFIGVSVALSDRDIAPNEQIVKNATLKPIKQCYIWSTDFGDRATLLLTIIDNNVEGSFSYIPKEKDSKRGVFTGTLSTIPGNSSNSTIRGWWNVLAEGVNNKEEILINLGEDTAAVGFGEMKEDDDGSYVYADITKISYQPILQEVDCNDMAIVN